MPDLGANQPIRSHTSTEQWKSFEVRMRQRRAERCLARASAACDAGAFDDARACLDEARRLHPDLPGLTDIEARVDGAAVLAPQPEAPEQDAPATGRVRRFVYVAGAAGLLMAAATFLAVRNASAPAEPATSPAVTAVAAPAHPGSRVNVVERFVTAPLTMATPEPPRTPVLDTVSAERRTVEPPTRQPAPSGPPAESRSQTAVPLATPPPPPAPVAEPQAAARNTPLPAENLPVAPPTRTLPEASAIEPPPAPETTIAAAPPAPPSKPEPSAAERTDDDVTRVRAVLSRYEAAYSGLDAAAARAVWPAVDERALARAFNSLQSQRVSLERCDVSVSGASARAECAGSATWVPKVGGSGRTETRRWLFDLRNASGAWQIVRAEAR